MLRAHDQSRTKPIQAPGQTGHMRAPHRCGRSVQMVIRTLDGGKQVHVEGDRVPEIGTSLVDAFGDGQKYYVSDVVGPSGGEIDVQNIIVIVSNDRRYHHRTVINHRALNLSKEK